ncbi:hypothetical protein KAR91_75040 [Candidatus Pacearchaeota archaeon]|nr:hypothetical protein [Candidatus Pacearchaeota archaeon]
MKCVHTADFHVDDKNIDEARKCLGFLFETVKTKKPDITILAGDLFDSRNVKLESMAARLLFEVVSEMANVSPVAIVYGTPSHEGEATAALRYLNTRYPIHVSDMPEQYYMMNDNSFVDNPGDSQPKLVISAVPQPTKKYFSSSGSIDSTNQEIASKMSGIFAGFGAKASQYDCPHILIGHFSISGAFLSATRQMIGFDIEISSDQIALAGANLVTMGHIHLPQKIPGKHNIFYSGSIFQNDFGEACEEKGFYCHEIDANGLQDSTFIQTPSRRFFKIRQDFTDTQDDFQVPFTPETLEKVKGAIVKIEIRVYEDDVAKIDRENLKQNMAEAVSYSIKIDNVPRVNVRSEAILKMTRLRDKIVEQARLRGEEVSESILLKADKLESESGDSVVDGVADCSSEKI